ncbi:MAG TPA: hypothetical protein VHZ76_05400, partial [Gammaproteobacteria bacterium]|nr:hypothetical protein [Gammaproteobacteria bacterium]
KQPVLSPQQIKVVATKPVMEYGLPQSRYDFVINRPDKSEKESDEQFLNLIGIIIDLPIWKNNKYAEKWRETVNYFLNTTLTNEKKREAVLSLNATYYVARLVVQQPAIRLPMFTEIQPGREDINNRHAFNYVLSIIDTHDLAEIEKLKSVKTLTDLNILMTEEEAKFEKTAKI